MCDVSLQQMFVDSHGDPIKVGENQVVQMDIIPICIGNVAIQFQGDCDGRFGVVFKSPQGTIKLSDGRCVNTVKTWDYPELPRTMQYHVECPDKGLRVWNIYI